MKKSSQSVTTINPQISPSDVLGSLTEQESDRTHEVFGVTHFAGGNERGPFFFEFGVIIEDFAGPTYVNTDLWMNLEGKVEKNVQSSHHIPRTNTINPNIIRCPLNRKRRRQLPNCRLSCIIRRLRLRHIHHRPRHTSNHHDASGALALDEVAGQARGEVVGAVDVDGPALLDALGRVVDGVEVLGEASGGDEVVDVAVQRDDVVDGLIRGVGAGDIGVVGGDTRGTVIALANVSLPL